jgi:nicotinamidase-related amidase
MVKSFRETIGVPPSTASPSDSALIIIDAQNEYKDGLLKVTNADSSLKAIQGLLETYRGL